MTDTKAKAGGIFAAIPRAMGQIKRIAKDSRNAEQKYDFASVDDFLAMTGPIMADNGLFIHMDETGVDNFERQGKYNVTHWTRYTFSLQVMHESGETLPPVTRSVEVIRSGAQASGSAQSYALKQFQRALFNIPTGDKDDADFQEKAEGAPVERKRGPSPADHAISSLAGADGPEHLAAVFYDLPVGLRSLPEVRGAAENAAVALLNSATTEAQLGAMWSPLKRAIQEFPAVADAKEKRKAELRAADADDFIPGEYEGKTNAA